MRLRKECEHGLYDRHHLSEGLKVGDLTHCPGGEFLPEGALVIEKVDGEWPQETIDHFVDEWSATGTVRAGFDALASQVGETE